MNMEVLNYRPLGGSIGDMGSDMEPGVRCTTCTVNRSVRLTYRGGKILMIGSQRPEELLELLNPGLRH